MSLFKNIVRVAISNITNFGTSFIIGFILPAILSVAEYGYYKEYTLFLSFAYLFNVGFNDGIYIKYGGEDINELDSKTVISEHNFILVFQLILMLISTAFFAYQGHVTLTLFSVVSFFVSLNTYHQNFLQATGNFAIFSRGTILKSIFYVFILLIGIFIIQSDQYMFYIGLNILSFVFLFIYYEYHYIKDIGFSTYWDTDNKFELFRVGIFILVANMSLTFVGNVGSWVVNRSFAIEEFAQYSFQNSILNVILLIVNAVGMVFYNVLSKNSSQSLVKMIKNASILLGVISGLAFFIFAVIIEYVFPQYTTSISILSMTFIAIPYIIISRILIANLYKSQRTEKKYFKDSVLFAGLSLAFVYSVYLFTGNMIAIAFSTTVCYIVWYLYTTRIEFKTLRSSDKKEYVILFSHILVFYVASNILTIVPGFILYLVYVLALLFFIKDDIQDVISLVRSKE